MLSYGANVILWDKILWKLLLSCDIECYQGELMWKLMLMENMLSCGTKCNHVVWMLSCGANPIMWSNCYHLESYVIMWDQMLRGRANVIMCSKCYHLKDYVIMWDQILSWGANIIMWNLMLSYETNSYHKEPNEPLCRWLQLAQLAKGKKSRP